MVVIKAGTNVMKNLINNIIGCFNNISYRYYLIIVLILLNTTADYGGSRDGHRAGIWPISGPSGGEREP